MRVKPQRIVKDSVFFMWDVLIPTPEDRINAARYELIAKDLILIT